MRPIPFTLSALFLSLSTQNVFANQAMDLESIMVIGESSSTLSTELAGSYDYLGREEIAYENIDDIKELLTKVPGVYLSRFNQGIVNTILSIRGFAGDGASPHAKLLIDGMPANMHAGYSELDQLSAININSIEMFRATSDPRYGLFNIAGNYQVNTRIDETKEIQLTLGSFNTREFQGYAGFEHDSFRHSYSAGYRESEGYRDHTDLDKQAFSGRWEWDVTRDTQLLAGVRYSRFEGDAPGYFDNPESARANPTHAAPFADQDGGVKENHHYHFGLLHEFNDELRWSLKFYDQNFKRNRWVRFSEASALQNRRDDQDQSGMISHLTWDMTSDWTLVWGLDIQNEDVIEQRFGTVGQSRTRDNSNVIRNRQYSYDTQGTFVQIQHNPTENLSWNIALRADELDGHFVEYNAQNMATPRNMFDFGTIYQPKFNLLYGLTEHTSLFFNAGRSFQHPIGKSAFTTGDVHARDMTFNDGMEFGFTWENANIDVRFSYWQQKAKDEFVSVDGEQINVGKTQRDGFDTALNWTINDKLLLWANYSFIDTEIERPSDNALDTVGNELRSIPDFTASLGLNYQLTDKLITRLHLDAQGDYYVNEDNAGGQFGDFTLLHLSADYDLDWATLKLQVNNLTDEYYEYVYDFGGLDEDGIYRGNTIHSPGDGRHFNISLNMEF